MRGGLGLAQLGLAASRSIVGESRGGRLGEHIFPISHAAGLDGSGMAPKIEASGPQGPGSRGAGNGFAHADWRVDGGLKVFCAIKSLLGRPNPERLHPQRLTVAGDLG